MRSESAILAAWEAAEAPALRRHVAREVETQLTAARRSAAMTPVDCVNAEAAIRAALDAGLEYGGAVAELARLAYGPPRADGVMTSRGYRELDASAPHGFAR